MYTEVVYLEDPSSDLIQEDGQSEPDEDEEGPEEFYCSSCDINITSVEEHIQQFHFGENIVVEVCPSCRFVFSILSIR